MTNESKLPKGWVEVKIEDIGAEKYYAIGDGDHGKITPNMYQSEGIPYIRVADIGWGTFSTEKMVYISENVHEENLKSELLPDDVLIAKTGATIGKCCIVPDYIKKANTTSSVGKVSINKNLTSSKYILYYFLSPKFYNLMWSYSNRTAQPGFNNRDLKIFPLPLPPKAEQERIVAKLDALFGQLEILKSHLQDVPQLLKEFRQSILNQAVTGQLKIDNGQLKVEHWKETTLEQASNKIQDGAHHSPKKQYPTKENGLFPYITSKNIRNNYMDLENILYVDEDYHNSIYPRCKPELGDILLTKDGANTGNVTLNELNEPISLLSSVCLIKTKQKILLPIFLKYYIQSPIGFKKIIGEMTGTAIKRIVLMKIKKTIITLPPLSEQEEIVKKVESLLAKADAIEQKYLALKQEIDTLPQSILAKAFQGKLVAQLPTDGSAKDLLEEIAKLKQW